METQNKSESGGQTYRIGAVSKLTGISPDTLRVWERRYQVVEPNRTVKGGRLYSREDVSRLVKIKALVDQGHAISTLVSLNEEELHQRLSQLSGMQPLVEQLDSHKVCVVGRALAIKVRYAEKPSHIEILGAFENIDDFAGSGLACDSLVFELPVIDADTIKLIDQDLLRQRASQIIVVYAFGQNRFIRQLGRYAAQVLKAPIADDLLWQALSRPLQAQQPVETDDITINNAELEIIPPRLFTPQQMAYCANIESKLQCECPHHMSQMIETMVAFEHYSASCENLTPDDASLHNYLHVMTAKARYMMEKALSTLLEAENIDVSKIASRINN
jgi:DNA-binding transcriptional MerR regulator